MSKTLLERVKAAEENLRPLFMRMDRDAKLAYLDPFTLKTFDDQEIYGAISVTMPDPAIFANAIISWIMAVKWQIKVEGELSATSQRYIEKYIDDSTFDVDERLVRKLKAKLFHIQASRICVRGWIGSRNVWRVDDKDIAYNDVLPMDMRFFSYEMGGEDMNFGGYKTRRSPAAILKLYGADNLPGGMDWSGTKPLELRDCWDDKWNRIYLEGKLIYHRRNKMGYPPFIIKPAPEGFMLLDKGFIVHEGESIFFLGRDMYKHYNQLVSIDQSIAMKQLDPSYQYHIDRANEQGPDKPPVPQLAGAVYTLKPGDKGYDLIPQPDVKNSNVVAHDKIENALKTAGLSEVELGGVSPMPPSALLVTEQAEIRNKIQAPRLEALSDYYVQSHRMSIQQFTAGDFVQKLGKRGSKHEYNAKGFADPETYDIEIKLMSKTRRQEIANVAIASAARATGAIPRDTIVRDILMSDDPEGTIALLDAEDASKLVPGLKLFEMALGAAKSAEDMHGIEKEAMNLKSIMLTREMMKVLNMPPQLPKEEKPTQELLPLGLKEGGI